MRFADYADAGCRLAAVLPAYLTGDSGSDGGDSSSSSTVLVCVPPGGIAVGAAVGAALGRDVVALESERDDSGVRVSVPVDVEGRRVVVIDDGVETGRAARTVAAALRAAGASHLVLAVPVCPREAEADLRHRYDEIVALDRPLVRRSLRWHYDRLA
jgi:predicted phosphoribosyltransferase